MSAVGGDALAARTLGVTGEHVLADQLPRLDPWRACRRGCWLRTCRCRGYRRGRADQGKSADEIPSRESFHAGSMWSAGGRAVSAESAPKAKSASLRGCGRSVAAW